jgi:hypothetical protein
MYYRSMDFLTDKSGRHLLRIHNTLAFPEYVKQASFDETAVSALPDTCFADGTHREFPINTPAHAFLSYSYCKSTGINDHRILARIKKAGTKLGMAQDLDLIDQAFGQIKQAVAEDESQFAINLDFDAGSEKLASGITGVQHFYPINNADEIQVSAVALDNHKSRIPLHLYVQGAREIVKAAKAAGVAPQFIPERIRLYGTEHYPDFEHVSWEAGRRVQLTGDNVYSEIAKSAADNTEGREMDEYAKLWELADASNGITYSKSLPDPYRIFNIGLDKQSYTDALARHIVLAGAVVPVEALTQVDTDMVKKQFSKAAANNVLDLLKSAAQAATDEATVLAASLAVPVQKALLKLIVAH